MGPTLPLVPGQERQAASSVSWAWRSWGSEMHGGPGSPLGDGLFMGPGLGERQWGDWAGGRLSGQLQADLVSITKRRSEGVPHLQSWGGWLLRPKLPSPLPPLPHLFPSSLVPGPAWSVPISRASWSGLNGAPKRCVHRQPQNMTILRVRAFAGITKLRTLR